jgi:hypothetical protein
MKKLTLNEMVAIEAGDYPAGCAVMGAVTVLAGFSIFFTGWAGAFATIAAIGGSAAMGCFESE